MPDINQTSTTEVKISELPLADQANDVDQFETNQSGVSRSVTLAQMRTQLLNGVTITPAVAAWLADPTSAKLAAAVTDETGSGKLVFSDNPALGGLPTVPTPTGPTGIANKSYVDVAIAAIPTPDLSAYAPKASPVFTGDPQITTDPAASDNDKSIPSTGWVRTAIATYAPTPDLTPYLPKAGGTMTGTLVSNKGSALTANQPAYTVQQTWNNGGVNFNGILLDITNTASAYPSYPLSVKINGGTWFWIDQFGGLFANGGLFTTGNAEIQSTAAPPAGGDLSKGLKMSSTAAFGVTFGSGAPDKAFAKGTVYLRSDGSGAPYYNSDGTGTGWLQIGSGGAVSVGLTPPASPSAGALWYYNDGTSGGGQLFIYYNDGNTTQWVPATPAAGTSTVLQTVSFQTGAVATGATVIPVDDTIPQQTEGDQYMSLAITPRSATSRLVISVTTICANSTGTRAITALFQDAAANALAVAEGFPSAANIPVTVTFKHTMISGTTSATTFKVRVGGGAASTTTFNGSGAARLFGGTYASSIVIQEVL